MTTCDQTVREEPTCCVRVVKVRTAEYENVLWLLGYAFVTHNPTGRMGCAREYDRTMHLLGITPTYITSPSDER